MQTPDGEWTPLVSPTGDMVAFVVSKEEDPVGPLKVVAYPTPAAPVQVSANPAIPVWIYWIGPNELAWVDTTPKMWRATVTAKDGKIDVGPTKPMFDGKPLDKQLSVLDYDLQHERFLIAIQDEPREDARLIIVSDWHQDAAGASPAH
jgi:hypothetical protein